MLEQKAKELMQKELGGFPGWEAAGFMLQELYKEQVFRNAYSPMKGWNLGSH